MVQWISQFSDGTNENHGNQYPMNIHEVNLLGNLIIW
jgi:hypothetical protein